MKTEAFYQWQEWNEQGLFPGPSETEADFIERVAYCQHLEQHLQKIGSQFPFEIVNHSSQDLLKKVLPATEELYGIRPQWVPIFFSNYRLAPWHGGCAWIFQLDEQAPTAAFLQLRARFRTSPTYLGLYHRRELMVHELAHIGRMLYQEPEFEEIFAYQSSPSRLRCWLGPIVQSPKESLFFVVLLAIVFLTDFVLLAYHIEIAVWIVWWLPFIPLLFIALALCRLLFRHHLLKLCSCNLEAVYCPKNARHLLYRLRDCEIKQFAHFSPSEIRDFIDSQAKESFRWHFLKTLYPFSSNLGGLNKS